MNRFPEVNEVPHQAAAEVLSPSRPPQLNEAVCSCHCGCRCSAQREGEDGDQNEDGASTHSFDTLVASNRSEADENFPLPSDGPESHVNADTFEAELPLSRDSNGLVHIEGVLNVTEIFRLGERMIDLEERAFRLPQGLPFPDYDDYPDSMKNEPNGSDDHSVIASDSRSIRCISPGPGLGAWIDDMNEYHFLEEPLRLTPQRRYCRGLVASHLVVRDA